MFNEELYQKLKPELDRLNQQNRTLSLATIDEKGIPYASYAPFVCIQENYYVFITELAPHTQHIFQNPNKISVMIIDDEEKSKNMFAICRSQYHVHATRIERDSEEGKLALGQLKERSGRTLKRLLDLNDFHLFRLKPIFGRLVTGFGKAFDLETENELRALHLTEEHLPKKAANI